MKTTQICTFLLLLFFLCIVPKPATAEDRIYLISYSSGTLFHELVRDRTKAVYKKAGLKVEFVAMPHKRSLISANDGSVDGDVGRVPSVLERYPNLRQVNVILMDLKGIVFTAHDEIKSYDESILQTYTVGHVRGVQWAEKKMTGLEATKVDNYTILFEMLLQGRIDIALATEVSANKVLLDLGERASTLRKLEPFIFAKPIYHYVNKKNEEIIPLKWTPSQGQ